MSNLNPNHLSAINQFYTLMTEQEVMGVNLTPEEITINHNVKQMFKNDVNHNTSLNCVTRHFDVRDGFTFDDLMEIVCDKTLDSYYMDESTVITIYFKYGFEIKIKLVNGEMTYFNTSVRCTRYITANDALVRLADMVMANENPVVKLLGGIMIQNKILEVNSKKQIVYIEEYIRSHKQPLDLLTMSILDSIENIGKPITDNESEDSFLERIAGFLSSPLELYLVKRFLESRIALNGILKLRRKYI